MNNASSIGGERLNVLSVLCIGWDLLYNERKEATSYEFGKGLTGSFTVKSGDVNTVADYMLVNVDPVNAVVSDDMLSLVNGNGQNLNEYLDMTVSSWSGNIIRTRAGESTGLRMIGVQLKNTVDFESFDKLVLKGANHSQTGCTDPNNHEYIAYALAVTDAEKSRTVTSPFEVTLHVQEEHKATNIKGKTIVYSSDASIPAASIGAYNNGGDAAEGDEGSYPVQMATPFSVTVGSDNGRVMASYIVVDYDNATLSTTDKAALKGMKFSGVDEVTKTLSHSITISGDYATGIPVPLKLVTIDYTGNVEVNVFWVKVGEPVLMDANFTVTPTTFVATPEAWTPASTMEEFKVPAGTSTFTISLVAGETSHQDATKFIETTKTAFANITDYLTLYKSDKETQTTTVKDVAYAKFAGDLNLMFMREDKEYEGVIKFYDAKGTYLGSNSISVKKVLPTVIPTGLTAKTNAIHSDGTLPVYPKPGTIVGEYELANSFNFSETLKEDEHLVFNTATFKVDNNIYAEYDTKKVADRKIINIVKDVIGSNNTYPTTVTYDYGDIKYHPEGHGVQEPGNHIVTWGTKFNIKFGCYPVDSKYAWYSAPTVYYQKEQTIFGVETNKDGKKINHDFVTVKNPYGYTVDPFGDADKDWTTWAPNLDDKDPKKVKVYLETVGNKEVNEFFIPSIVEENNVYGLQLKRNPSITTVLENDVETMVYNPIDSYNIELNVDVNQMAILNAVEGNTINLEKIDWNNLGLLSFRIYLDETKTNATNNSNYIDLVLENSKLYLHAEANYPGGATIFIDKIISAVYDMPELVNAIIELTNKEDAQITSNNSVAFASVNENISKEQTIVGSIVSILNRLINQHSVNEILPDLIKAIVGIASKDIAINDLISNNLSYDENFGTVLALGAKGDDNSVTEKLQITVTIDFMGSPVPVTIDLASALFGQNAKFLALDFNNFNYGSISSLGNGNYMNSGDEINFVEDWKLRHPTTIVSIKNIEELNSLTLSESEIINFLINKELSATAILANGDEVTTDVYYQGEDPIQELKVKIFSAKINSIENGKANVTIYVGRYLNSKIMGFIPTFDTIGFDMLGFPTGLYEYNFNVTLTDAVA